MNKVINFLAVFALFTGVSSEVYGQKNVRESLSKDFKQLDFDTLTLDAANTFETDKNQLKTLDQSIIEWSRLNDMNEDVSLGTEIYFAIGTFKLSKNEHAYLIRSWSENKRENQTQLFVIRIEEDVCTLINRYFVGLASGSECCEVNTSARVFDQNGDGQLDLIIESHQRETNSNEEVVTKRTSVYFWDDTDFKIDTVSSLASHSYLE